MVRLANLGAYSSLEFLTAKSPEELKAAVTAIGDSVDLVALYAQGSSHVAWFVRNTPPVAEKPQPKVTKKLKGA